MFEARRRGLIAFLALGLLWSAAGAENSPWGAFIEPDFPFFSTVLDARDLEGDWPEETRHNLIPRGIVLRLDHGVRVCFDPDLLRVALVWRETEEGDCISMDSMAAGSYHDAGKKAPGGQKTLPKPVGRIYRSEAIYPGVRIQSEKPWLDPRVHSADPNEVGLGPLSAETHQWLGLELRGDRVMLFYRVGGVDVRETMRAVKGQQGLELLRYLDLEGPGRTLQFRTGISSNGTEDIASYDHTGGESAHVISYPLEGTANDGTDSLAKLTSPSPRRWPNAVEATRALSEESMPAYVIEKLPLPLENPWKRNIRLSGFDFFEDGRAAFCTFDGDVWIATALKADWSKVTWERFASGLNEPMSLQIIEGRIHVFDRGGIWQLLDEDGNGEADHYKMHCNLFAQTAETREFANDMVKKPDGSLILAKAGQSDTTQGIHNGKILMVAPNGESFEVIAGGLRQPFIGYDPEKDWITSSDQQGHWIPSTPLHIIQTGAHYGFIPTKLKEVKHPKPITEPLCWIPHFVNQSGASQITNRDSRFGPMAGQLLHLGFNRPELFAVYADGSQGGVANFLTGFDTGTLRMAVNPEDGQLYFCGFKIWGTVAEKVTGFYRVRYTERGMVETPEWAQTTSQGVLLRFRFPVEESIARNLGSYSVDRWNYVRSSDYGSGHYKLDGSPGQESLSVSSVYISEDQRSIFLGIPDMQPCHQLRVTYRLPLPAEVPQVRSVYFTVHELRKLDIASVGFASSEVDLTKREALADTAQEPSTEIGQHLYTALGCVACHSIDGTKAEKVGPTWLGLYGSKREFTDGTFVKQADEVYLRESILNPARKMTAGYAGEGVGMPSYLGILQDYQVDSLILYIKSLKPGKKKKS